MYQIDIFLYIFNDFDVLISKIKKIYFDIVLSEKYYTPQYKTHSIIIVIKNIKNICYRLFMFFYFKLKFFSFSDHFNILILKIIYFQIKKYF